MDIVIYLGPRLHHLGLGYGAVFNGGLHPSLDEPIKQCPAIKELFVPIEQAAEVRKELRFDFGHNMRGTQGRYVTFYREVQKWIAERTKPKTPTVTLKTHV